MKTYGLDENGYYIDKDPQAKLDYSHDWTDWLATGDTIATSEWAADAGITLTGSVIAGGLVTTIYAAGGTVGMEYKITNTITTTDGRIDERSFRLIIREQ